MDKTITVKYDLWKKIKLEEIEGDFKSMSDTIKHLIKNGWKNEKN